MLDANSLRAHCLGQKAAVEEFPFGPEARVFKVMGKMFALMPVEADPPSISLKCDPLLAEALRETYPAIQPAYHMNKKHWNMVSVDGTITDEEVRDLIDASYDLVVSGLPRRDRDTLKNT